MSRFTRASLALAAMTVAGTMAAAPAQAASASVITYLMGNGTISTVTCPDLKSFLTDNEIDTKDKKYDTRAELYKALDKKSTTLGINLGVANVTANQIDGLSDRAVQCKFVHDDSNDFPILSSKDSVLGKIFGPLLEILKVIKPLLDEITRLINATNRLAG